MVFLVISGERLTERLNGESLKAMLRQRMSWFDRPENTLGSMMYRITVDVATINTVIIVAFATSWNS